MFSLTVKTEDTTKRVADAAQKANFKNLGHAAASLRKDAVASIQRSKGPSQPGQPVHTRKGLARRALLYAMSADKSSAVVGFSSSVIGRAMHAHEFGGEFRGQDYPERPVMTPALERAITRLAGEWKGTIGQ